MVFRLDCQPPGISKDCVAVPPSARFSRCGGKGQCRGLRTHQRSDHQIEHSVFRRFILRRNTSSTLETIFRVEERTSNAKHHSATTPVVSENPSPSRGLAAGRKLHRLHPALAKELPKRIGKQRIAVMNEVRRVQQKSIGEISGDPPHPFTIGIDTDAGDEHRASP